MEPKPAHAYFRFYAELNDHLPPDQRYEAHGKSFFVPSTVKDMIESFGVPHTEVELIIINGESTDFSHVVRDGDRIGVYPMFESVDITPELRVRSQPLRDLTFVLDVHLGKLAAYLRMLGFDALYRSCYTDPELVQISSIERRILLTRDRGLLKHRAISHGYWLRETDSRRQAAEVVQRFDLAHFIRPFTRCMACNGVIESVSREHVRDRLLPHTAELYDEFRQCPQCGRVYWKGTHYERMRRWIEELASNARR
ncbi:MAG: Mut7-C RNAse domain-containing protein [Bryobacteraceae bacterium]